MRDNEEINERFAKTISLYSLICEFLCREGYRTLTIAEYQKTLDLIYCPETPEAESNAGAVENLIKKTAVNSTTNLHWTLPSGSLREFVSQYKGGRQVYLCRQKLMDSQTAKDVIALICQQPPAFR